MNETADVGAAGDYNGGNIIIGGNAVIDKAHGNGEAAGIGGGQYADSGNIVIKDNAHIILAQGEAGARASAAATPATSAVSSSGTTPRLIWPRAEPRPTATALRRVAQALAAALRERSRKLPGAAAAAPLRSRAMPR